MFKMDLLTYEKQEENGVTVQKVIDSSDYQSLEEVNAQADAVNKAEFSKRVLYTPHPYPMLDAVRITDNKTPGFMFWSISVSPYENDVIVWDTAGKVCVCMCVLIDIV